MSGFCDFVGKIDDGGIAISILLEGVPSAGDFDFVPAGMTQDDNGTSVGDCQKVWIIDESLGHGLASLAACFVAEGRVREDEIKIFPKRC